MTPGIWLHSYISILLSHHHSQLPPEVDGNKFRDPQMECRVRDLGTFSTMEGLQMTPNPSPWDSGNPVKEVEKA